MFGIGANELIIILIFGFIIFGPDKLPAMAKTVGQFIARFRSAQAEMSRVIKTEVYDPDAEDPFKNPLDALSKIENQVKKEDKGESFTERKARYDKQRAAKKAAEERKEKIEARRAAEVEAKSAALESGASEEDAKQAAKAAGDAVAAQIDESRAQAKAEAEAKRPTADELYGTKPQVKKPVKKAASQANGSQASQPGPTASSPAAEVDKQAEEATDASTASASAGSAEATAEGEGR